jgi:hypothetical protein
MGQKQELKDQKPESSVEHDIANTTTNHRSLVARTTLAAAAMINPLQQTRLAI